MCFIGDDNSNGNEVLDGEGYEEGIAEIEF